MKKLWILIFSCLFFIILLSGCSIAQVSQLHERLIIQGIGIDKEDEDLKLTVHILNAESTDEKDNGEITVLQSTGKSILDAFSNLTKLTGKEPLFSQNMIVVVGEECAKNGINSFIDFFIRYYEVRPAVAMFVSKTTASEILTCKYDENFVTAREIENLASSSNLSASYKYSNIMDVTNSLMSDLSDPTIMALDVKSDDMGDRPGAYAMALFKKDSLVGYADTQQSKALLLIGGDMNNTTIVTNIDENAGDASLTVTNSNSEISLAEQTNTINIKINVAVSLYSLDNADCKRLPNEYMEVIECKVSDYLKSICESTISTVIKQQKTDVINLGKKIRLKYPEFMKANQNDWENVMSNLNYNIEVFTEVDKTGREMSPL